MLLAVKGEKVWNRKQARLYEGMPILETIVWKASTVNNRRVK